MPGTCSRTPSCSTRGSNRGPSARSTWRRPTACDVFVDVTDTFERKLDALRCHVSQMTDLDGLDARIRGWNAANAQEGDLPAGRLAECYLRVDTK